MQDDASSQPVEHANADGKVPPAPSASQFLEPPAKQEPPTPAQPVSNHPQSANLTDLEEQIGRVDRWMIRLTGAIALFTLALVIVGVLQWSAMRGQLDEMKSGGAVTHELAVAAGRQAEAAIVQAQRTESLATTASVQALAAKDSADTAAETLRQIKVSFVTQQRPYIIEEARVWVQPPGTTGQTAVNVFMKNIGRSPAIKSEVAARLIRYKSGDAEQLFGFLEGAFRGLNGSFISKTKSKYFAFVRHDLAPEEHYFATATDGGWNNGYAPLTVQEMADLTSGTLTLFLIVKARYYDAFNSSYETESCQIYFGSEPTVWHICDSHNSIK